MFAVSVSPVSVGSNIFFALALCSISVLVLLLLRRFLTLRATPAYLIVPVFLALALPASVVLLVPIDLASSSRDGTGPKAIWLPDRVVLVCWRIAYWLIFMLTWYVYCALPVNPQKLTDPGPFFLYSASTSTRDTGNPKPASFTPSARTPDTK